MLLTTVLGQFVCFHLSFLRGKAKRVIQTLCHGCFREKALRNDVCFVPYCVAHTRRDPCNCCQHASRWTSAVLVAISLFWFSGRTSSVMDVEHLLYESVCFSMLLALQIVFPVCIRISVSSVHLPQRCSPLPLPTGFSPWVRLKEKAIALKRNYTSTSNPLETGTCVLIVGT